MWPLSRCIRGAGHYAQGKAPLCSVGLLASSGATRMGENRLLAPMPELLYDVVGDANDVILNILRCISANIELYFKYAHISPELESFFDKKGKLLKLVSFW